MFYRFYPFTSFLSRKVLGSNTNDVSERVAETIAPSEHARVAGVDITPFDRELIRDTDRSTKLDIETERLDSRDVEHLATVRRVLKNVFATPNGIFGFSDEMYRSRRPSPMDFEFGQCPVFDKGFHAVPAIARHYFGHWLLDALPATYLRRDDEVLFLPFDAAWSHAPDYLDRLGLRPARARSAFFRELAVVSDVGMNADRRRRLTGVRSKLRASVGRGGTRRVFLRRGMTGTARAIANEQAVSDFLAANGFTEVLVSDPLDRILGALRDAEVCVSMEGSHMAHATIGLPRGALLLALVPADRFITLFADYCTALDNRMAIVTLERRGSAYDVDLGRLAAALDRNGIAMDAPRIH